MSSTATVRAGPTSWSTYSNGHKSRPSSKPVIGQWRRCHQGFRLNDPSEHRFRAVPWEVRERKRFRLYSFGRKWLSFEKLAEI